MEENTCSHQIQDLAICLYRFETISEIHTASRDESLVQVHAMISADSTPPMQYIYSSLYRKCRLRKVGYGSLGDSGDKVEL